MSMLSISSLRHFPTAAFLIIINESNFYETYTYY